MPQPDTMPTAVALLATGVLAVFLVAWQTRQLAQMQRDVITAHALLEDVHEKIDGLHEEVNKKLDGMQDEVNKKFDGLRKANINKKLDSMSETDIRNKLDRMREEEFMESQITNLASDDSTPSTIGDMETQTEDHVESLDNCRDPNYDPLMRSLDQDKEQEEQPSDID